MNLKLLLGALLAMGSTALADVAGDLAVIKATVPVQKELARWDLKPNNPDLVEFHVKYEQLFEKATLKTIDTVAKKIRAQMDRDIALLTPKSKFNTSSGRIAAANLLWIETSLTKHLAKLEAIKPETEKSAPAAPGASSSSGHAK